MKEKWIVAATAVVASCLVAPYARAVCRVVEPYEDSEENPVVFDPTTTAIMVLATDQLVDWSCPEAPVGRPLGDVTRPLHYRSPFEPAHALPQDEVAEATEGRRCWDGREATPILGSLVHVIVRPAIYASGGTAGLVMPVPTRADVHVAPNEVFDAVAGLRRANVHETVTYVEDGSVGYQCTDPHYADATPWLDGLLAAPSMVMGCGEYGDGDYYRPGLDDVPVETFDSGDGVVNLERIETTEDYEVTMLNASTLDALLTWLDDNGLAHDEVDDAAFAHYVQDGAWFMAVKVTPQDLDGERVALAPLVVTWRGDRIPIMNALQYEPAGGQLVTDAWIVAPSRMAVADGDGETLYAAPADVASSPMLSGFALSSSWLTRVELVRRTEEVKDDSYLEAVETPDVVRPDIEREVTVRIAAACCEGNAQPSYGYSRTHTEERAYLDGDEAPGGDTYYRAPPADPAYCPGGAMYSDPYSYDSGSSGGGLGGGLFCSADGHSPPKALAALGSWLPVLLLLGGLLSRRRPRN